MEDGSSSRSSSIHIRIGRKKRHADITSLRPHTPFKSIQRIAGLRLEIIVVREHNKKSRNDFQ